MLDGYKTYIVCAAAILTAVGAYLSKAITLQELIAAVFAAVYGITTRKAIAGK